MSTPWRIELYEDLLVSVEDVLGEGFADEDLDMAGAFDGGLGGFQEPAYCAGIDAIDKLRYVVWGDLLTVEEVLFSLLIKQQYGWDVLDLDSQIFNESIEEAVTIILIWLCNNQTLRTWGFISSECLLGRWGGIIAICKQYQGGFFVSKDLLDGALVKGDDCGVYIQDQYDCYKKDLFDHL